ncbi:MAG: ATP-binding protein [Gammaproteobacteria bacterium]|nr:ATP-binding protein [Gammaproteobacteria bacterium]
MTLGYPESELHQLDVLTFVAPSQHEVTIEAMARVFEHGENWVEISLIDKDGNQRPYFFSARLHSVSDAPSLLTIGIDLTDQKAAEQERQTLQQQLLQSQKLESLGLLAGGISHDFNNLLTTIIGYSNLLLEYKEVDQDFVGPLGEIHRAGERAAELTGQLLAFSRHQELRPQVVDLREIVKQLQPMLDRLLEETITLNVLTPDQVPPINADTGQLEQIIINLVVNARDAMPDGGRITLTIEHTDTLPHHLVENDRRPEGIVKLTVEDNGTGIDDNMKQKIFEPFFTTKEIGKGTGSACPPSTASFTSQVGGSMSKASRDKAVDLWCISRSRTVPSIPITQRLSTLTRYSKVRKPSCSSKTMPLSASSAPACSSAMAIASFLQRPARKRWSNSIIITAESGSC